MASSKEFPLVKISGKLGNVVFYERNGKLCLRSRPKSISKSASAKQLYQRAVFKKVTGFLHPIRTVIEFGFGGLYSDKAKRFSRALSVGIKKAIFPKNGVPELKPENFLISQGDLTPPVDCHVEWIESNKVRIIWRPNVFEGLASEGDILLYLAYDPVIKRKWSVIQGKSRKSGVQEVDFPWTGPLTHRFYHYLAFYRKTKKGEEFSDSICLGLI